MVYNTTMTENSDFKPPVNAAGESVSYIGPDGKFVRVIDQERAAKIRAFEEKTKDTFQTVPPEQEAEVRREYDMARNDPKSRYYLAGTVEPGDEIELPAGHVIERGGGLQELKKPLKVKVDDFDYQYAISRLPDESKVYFPFRRKRKQSE